MELESHDHRIIHAIREQFPVLHREVNGHPYIYLDNSATTQKPRVVLNKLSQFYAQDYATVHRGVYALSQEATEAFDHVRDTTKDFLGAKSPNEIIFVRGATEAINLVAYSYGRYLLKPGQDVIVSEMEHHANLLPWQILCKENNLNLKIVPIDDNGELVMETYTSLLSENTGLVAITHVSNALGTINPIQDIIEMAHTVGAKVLIDGAQAAGHVHVDVQALDVDFYAMSSHKLFGPTGVGVLYGKYELLEQMPPYQTGGAMIESVSLDSTSYAKPPMRFEAGTPAIAEVIGFGEALSFIDSITRGYIAEYEDRLLNYATEKISQIPGVRIIGTAGKKASVLSFVLDNIHPHDAGTILDEQGIAVRVGHHCAQPIMKRYNVAATIRASFGIYNLPSDVDRLVDGIHKVRKVMGEA